MIEKKRKNRQTQRVNSEAKKQTIYQIEEMKKEEKTTELRLSELYDRLSELYDNVNTGHPDCLKMLDALKEQYPECENDAEYHYLRGFTLHNHHDLSQEALVAYDKAIELDNGYQTLYYYDRYETLVALGLNERSELDKAIVIKRDPSWFPDSPECIALSIIHLSELIQLSPNKWSLFYQRGNMYRSLKDFENCLKDIRTAFSLIEEENKLSDKGV